MVDQAKQVTEQAGQATETAKGVTEGAAQQAVGSISGELRNLGREVTAEAIKVLTPAAKQAAEKAAQELMARAPDLVRDYGTQLIRRGGAAAVGGVGRAGSAAVGGVTGAVTGVATGVAKAGASAAGGLVSRLRPGRRGKGATASGTGRGRRLPIQSSVDVGVPLESAYAQWTQFEEFPKYMFRTERIEQKDDTHLEWHSKIWGIRRSWQAEITEQRPKERIVWKATSGANHVGVITFHPLAHNLTRVQVNLDFQPTGLLEKFGSGVRATRRAVQSDLMRFKALIEMRKEPRGEWPGTVEEGEVVEQEQPAEGEERAGEERAAEAPEERPEGEAEEEAPQAEAEERAQEPAEQEPAEQQPAEAEAEEEPKAEEERAGEPAAEGQEQRAGAATRAPQRSAGDSF
jgi:uncharacterized membrane protein